LLDMKYAKIILKMHGVESTHISTLLNFD